MPFISTFAVFAVKRALDQMRVVIAQPSLNVKITGGYSGILTGKTGKTHQAVEDIAVMRAMPHMTVMAPADGLELRGMLRAACDYAGADVYSPDARSQPGHLRHSYQFTLGKAVVLREGGDVAFISTGVQTTRALEAADLLAAEGVGVTCCMCRRSSPSTWMPSSTPRRTGRVVTAEDHSILGGLGGAVAETLSEHRPR